ncbi:hypothetical protein CAPTEDRAFT_114441 [Capitella teleta]|uniref:Uncharacterized protein n=1 Tax=Capitella teleta TaxID=283909 RepID=R7UHD1_CAPTE|nr:hypothetical protein CAPTEDRAFT_114441 [Capitella teleta]|eukprot:ELU02682.1 hypothetical protein CAPTEDRAFT_114441 [Capitella teleta]
MSDSNLIRNERRLLKQTTSLEKKLKSSPKVSLLVAIKPENTDSEKEKFMKSNYHISPQFIYKHPINSSSMERMSQPSQFLLPLAVKIMRHAISKHGSYEKFEESSGGCKLTRMQIVECVRNHLKQEDMEDEVQIKVCDDLLSRGCMTRMRGQPTVQVRAHNIREKWIEGLLRHELGTHYLRSCNNKLQPWSEWKRRQEMNLQSCNPTEEGLASLHSVIFRPHPVLWKNALLYYATCKAFEMSFSQLFKEMGQFVKDPSIRWEYCLRAKRGQSDTSQPGAFTKDQVYLKGALEILKYRHKIDFHFLVRCGKVCHRDLYKLKEFANLEGTRIPTFMENMNEYRRSLDRIMLANGLTDEDLAML